MREADRRTERAVCAAVDSGIALPIADGTPTSSELLLRENVSAHTTTPLGVVLGADQSRYMFGWRYEHV